MVLAILSVFRFLRSQSAKNETQKKMKYRCERSDLGYRLSPVNEACKDKEQLCTLNFALLTLWVGEVARRRQPTYAGRLQHAALDRVGQHIGGDCAEDGQRRPCAPAGGEREDRVAVEWRVYWADRAGQPILRHLGQLGRL